MTSPQRPSGDGAGIEREQDAIRPFWRFAQSTYSFPAVERTRDLNGGVPTVRGASAQYQSTVSTPQEPSVGQNSTAMYPNRIGLLSDSGHDDPNRDLNEGSYMPPGNPRQTGSFAFGLPIRLRQKGFDLDGRTHVPSQNPRQTFSFGLPIRPRQQGPHQVTAPTPRVEWDFNGPEPVPWGTQGTTAYSELQPSRVAPWRGFPRVRRKMAIAKDRGIDVNDVLLRQFRKALYEKGYRRVDIHSLNTQAARMLDTARENQLDMDMVDMIMAMADAAPNKSPTRRAPIIESRRAKSLRIKSQLRLSKLELQRLYQQEEVLSGLRQNVIEMEEVVQRRAAAERHYVNHLIQCARRHNLMTPSAANALQQQFTRKSRHNEPGAPYKDYLLSLFPHLSL